MTLLERRQLTSGTTWHAAGLVGQLRTSINMTELARYTSELYLRLEAETGQATGYRRCGSYFARHQRGTVRGIAAQCVDGEGIRASGGSGHARGHQGPGSATAYRRRARGHPHTDSDGYANAVDVTNALAKGATAAGARIYQNVPVTAIRTAGGSVAGVATERGEIDADCVVLCTGMWTRELAASVGVNVPLHACEHYYALFESVEGLDSSFPVVRDYDACAYYKYDAGKLLLGAFEPNARPWATEGIPGTSASTRSTAAWSTSNRSWSRPWSACRRLHPPGLRPSSAARRVSRRTCATTSARRPNWITVSWRRG